MTKNIEVLSDLTQIPLHTLNRLQQQSETVACHALSEALLLDEDLRFDIGYGVVTLEVREDSVTWHFTPSARFEKKVANTLVTKHSPLIALGEERLAKKIATAYKDLVG